MVISLIFSTLGVFVMVVIGIIRLARKDTDSAGLGMMFCAHMFTFLSGIIGFPLGLSFALYDQASVVGAAGALAIVAIMLNMLSTCMLCFGLAKSKSLHSDKNEQPSWQVQPPNPAVRYESDNRAMSAF